MAGGADPLAAGTRLIALVIVGNQPLYPLYLHWLVGAGALASCWTLASTPAFLGAALLAPRHSLWGRLLLPLAGLGNTVLSAKLLGANVGLGLFVIPCLLIALLALRPREWQCQALLAGLCAIALWILPSVGAEPLAALDATQTAHLLRLNAWSVASLTLFVCWKLGQARLREFRLARPCAAPAGQ